MCYIPNSRLLLLPYVMITTYRTILHVTRQSSIPTNSCRPGISQFVGSIIRIRRACAFLIIDPGWIYRRTCLAVTTAAALHTIWSTVAASGSLGIELGHIGLRGSGLPNALTAPLWTPFSRSNTSDALHLCILRWFRIAEITLALRIHGPFIYKEIQVHATTTSFCRCVVRVKDIRSIETE